MQTLHSYDDHIPRVRFLKYNYSDFKEVSKIIKAMIDSLNSNDYKNICLARAVYCYNTIQACSLKIMYFLTDAFLITNISMSQYLDENSNFEPENIRDYNNINEAIDKVNEFYYAANVCLRLIARIINADSESKMKILNNIFEKVEGYAKAITETNYKN